MKKLPRSQSTMPDGLRTAWQYLLPHHALSRLVHRVTRLRMRAVKSVLIKTFIRSYGVDMSEAAQPDPTAYPSFNAFFTRRLRPTARPICADPGAVVSPIDGIISQLGAISAERIFQAKDTQFGVADLLGGDDSLAGDFIDGAFVTLYLAPRDYHRVHMPLTGRLDHMIHVPGALFSVNPASTRAIPRLFARNERVITIFNSSIGRWALVLVGALCVGSIETVWAGEVTPPRGRRVSTWSYPQGDGALKLTKGSEMGRFNMGSTVILLFPEGRTSWSPRFAPDARVYTGQALGLLSNREDTWKD